LLEFQHAFQRKQLREAPEQERRILIESYLKRGLDPRDAHKFADVVMLDHEQAVRLLLFEEVGLDDRSIGSPIQAAVGSFIAFTAGALIPLLPFLVAGAQVAFYSGLFASLGALGILGLAIARLTRRSALFCAVRQIALGGAAAAVTYTIGAALGVSSGA
jgi:VIT1/CCC1 family predicted Fe2+/Mn2+ transporter